MNYNPCDPCFTLKYNIPHYNFLLLLLKTWIKMHSSPLICESHKSTNSYSVPISWQTIGQSTPQFFHHVCSNIQRRKKLLQLIFPILWFHVIWRSSVCIFTSNHIYSPYVNLMIIANFVWFRTSFYLEKCGKKHMRE